MESMLNVNVTQKPPGPILPKKLSKKEQAKLDYKSRDEKFKALYSPDFDPEQDPYSGTDELDTQEEEDFQQSIKTLEQGWDLDVDNNNKGEEEIGNEDTDGGDTGVQEMQENQPDTQPTIQQLQPLPATPTNVISKKKDKTKPKTKQTKKNPSYSKIAADLKGKTADKKKEDIEKKKGILPSTGGKGGNNVNKSSDATVPTSAQTAQELHYRYPVSNQSIMQEPAYNKQEVPAPNLFEPVSPTVSAFPSLSKQPEVADGDVKATRVCKPGVVKSYFDGKPNCLIIGDSIALG